MDSSAVGSADRRYVAAPRFHHRALVNVSRSTSLNGRDRRCLGHAPRAPPLIPRRPRHRGPNLLAQRQARGSDALEADRNDDFLVLEPKLAAKVDGDSSQDVVPRGSDIAECPLEPLVPAFFEIRRVYRIVDVEIRIHVPPADLDALSCALTGRPGSDAAREPAPRRSHRAGCSRVGDVRGFLNVPSRTRTATCSWASRKGALMDERLGSVGGVELRVGGGLQPLAVDLEAADEDGEGIEGETDVSSRREHRRVVLCRSRSYASGRPRRWPGSPVRRPIAVPAFPRASSATSGFSFCGIIEEPVAAASGSARRTPPLPRGRSPHRSARGA